MTKPKDIHWLKALLFAIGAALAVIFGVAAVKKIRALVPSILTGKVANPTTFEQIPGDSQHILVASGESYWTQAKLPDGVKPSQVKAAGFPVGQPGYVEVEVDHAVTDRTSAPTASPGATLGL